MKVAQSCLTLCDPMNYTVHGILQARILEWVAVPSSRGSSQPGIKPRSPTLQADSLPAESSYEHRCVINYFLSLKNGKNIPLASYFVGCNMAPGPITSQEIDGETVETVSDFIFGLQNHCRW